jgi:hypothetical protein
MQSNFVLLSLLGLAGLFGLHFITAVGLACQTHVPTGLVRPISLQSAVAGQQVRKGCLIKKALPANFFPLAYLVNRGGTFRLPKRVRLGTAPVQVLAELLGEIAFEVAEDRLKNKVLDSLGRRCSSAIGHELGLLGPAIEIPLVGRDTGDVGGLLAALDVFL